MDNFFTYLFENESLKPYSTLNLNQFCKFVVIAYNLETIVEGIKFAQNKRLPYIIIGYGSNIAFIDNFEGVLIVNRIKDITIKDNQIISTSGSVLNNVIKFSIENGFTGAEELYNIPGSIGGAVLGNAGSYGKEISNFVVWIKVLNLETFNIDKIEKKNLNFSYRKSSIDSNKFFIYKIALKLNKDNSSDKKTKFSKLQEFVDIRKSKIEPLPSCGSFFKNVEVDNKKIITGQLVDRLHLKGYKIGDIKISNKHGNIVVNCGNGDGKSLLQLIQYIKKRVFDEYKINLQPEVKLVGKSGFINLQ